ncbi:MAG: anhydro-N-acetylmuramic acid kinase [Rhodospirillaceae bacterium]|nr:MAG: anhydro-N-acetylmuramic acid kinase [Rhodospirillaceae bacterium]
MAHITLNRESERPLKVIGLMSGTSMDGIDAAYLETDGGQMVRPGPAVSIPFAPQFRARLTAFVASAPERAGGAAEALEAELTDLHAVAVRQLMENLDGDMGDLDLVGFHGQTVWHRPAEGETWQMGDGERLAKALGLPVAFDFRSDDVRAGGQGAPLLPAYHAALAAGTGDGLAVLNIGGVANVTWVGAAPGAESPELLGFDTGPGNGLIDDWVARRLGLSMDRDGAIAAAGRVDEGVLAQLMSHVYFAARPPKSLDRYAFDVSPVTHLSTEDGAATLTAFTAAAVAEGLAHCPRRAGRLLVTGGGRHNPTLMAELRRRTGADVVAVEEVGWQGDALEAQGFAYLAVRCLRGLPITFPGTTGVASPLKGGRIVAP